MCPAISPATLDFIGLKLDTNFTIYYAQAIVNGRSIAEKLNGALGVTDTNGGRFCWVSNYNAGFWSSTNVVYTDGTTNRLNTALVTSCSIDSNGNGVRNCMDTNPIPVVSPATLRFTATLTNRPSPAVVLSWNTVPLTTNYLYSAASLDLPITNCACDQFPVGHNHRRPGYRDGPGQVLTGYGLLPCSSGLAVAGRFGIAKQGWGWMAPQLVFASVVSEFLKRLEVLCEDATRNIPFAGRLGIRRSVLLACLSLAASVGWAQTSFSTAQVITGQWGSVTNDNTGVVPDPGGPSPAGFAPQHPLWYKWTAPESGEVTLDTIGSVDAGGTNLDTVVAVYTGRACRSCSKWPPTTTIIRSRQPILTTGGR